MAQDTTAWKYSSGHQIVGFILILSKNEDDNPKAFHFLLLSCTTLSGSS